MIPVLVLAGAGTDETRVLVTCKISHILSIGRARAGEIAARSPSHRKQGGARRMKLRLGQMLGRALIEEMPLARHLSFHRRTHSALSCRTGAVEEIQFHRATRCRRPSSGWLGPDCWPPTISTTSAGRRPDAGYGLIDGWKRSRVDAVAGGVAFPGEGRGVRQLSRGEASSMRPIGNILRIINAVFVFLSFAGKHPAVPRASRR